MAEKSSSEVVQESIYESVDKWRASQGLPPIDRSKDARKDEKPKK